MHKIVLIDSNQPKILSHSGLVRGKNIMVIRVNGKGFGLKLPSKRTIK